ncbi:hypothetical protein H6P81_004815 [Aristolochia fimbriata]|uniref:DNA-directed RNA polymerase III subunit RPC3 n=1 Tax=Aristolochia fimbriata TaxID=158543 RepID=A0AAV7ETV4_ARIFI|nr:hypothetical protein H6P81_004815 [Aristolochia fimbriata]
MPSQHGVSLAVSIITTHFGDQVGKVCGCLLRAGPLTIQEIARYTELPHPQLKNCLLVLIQHNCVQAFSMEKLGGFGVQVKVITQYMALFDNILHRVRFPKFIAVVAERFDKMCESLLEGLLEHGRLTLEQVMMRAMSKRTEGNADLLRTSFTKLVHAHFVERCPPGEPFLETLDDSQPAKRAKSAGPPETIEQKAMKAAGLSEAERYFIISNGESNSLDTEDGEKSTTIPGKKRKHDTLEDDTEVSIHDKEVLWRPNFEEFVRCFRHKACVERVRASLNVGAAAVLEAILEATRSTEKKIKEEKSAPLLLETIMQEAIRRPGSPQSIDQVRAVLDELGGHSSVEETDLLYSIDLRNIIEAARNAEVESVVSRRYGKNAYRIFRLLVKKDCLVETERISEETLIDKKETTKILYRLFADGILHMEKAASHEQARFLLWRVMKNTQWEHVLDEMYHAALNLSQRIAHELELEHEVIVRPRDQLDEIQMKRLQRVIKVKTGKEKDVSYRLLVNLMLKQSLPAGSGNGAERCHV